MVFDPNDPKWDLLRPIADLFLGDGKGPSTTQTIGCGLLALIIAIVVMVVLI